MSILLLFVCMCVLFASAPIAYHTYFFTKAYLNQAPLDAILMPAPKRLNAYAHVVEEKEKKANQ